MYLTFIFINFLLIVAFAAPYPPMTNLTELAESSEKTGLFTLKHFPPSIPSNIKKTYRPRQIYHIDDNHYITLNGDLYEKLDNSTASKPEYRILNFGCKYHKEAQYKIDDIIEIDMSEIQPCKSVEADSGAIAFLWEDRYLSADVAYFPYVDVDTDHFYGYLHTNYNFTTNTTTDHRVQLFAQVFSNQTGHIEFHGQRFEVEFRTRVVFENECSSSVFPDFKMFWKSSVAMFPTVGDSQVYWGDDCPSGYKSRF